MENLPAVNPIRYYRKKEDLTQADLAKMLNQQRINGKPVSRYEIKNTNISYWENGTKRVPLRVAQVMADLLGISIEKFREWQEKSVA